MHRREFLTHLARTTLGVSVLPVASGLLADLIAEDSHDSKDLPGGQPLPRRPTARHVIWLTMAGGMSHLDTWDPKPENPEIQGPVETIESNINGLRLSQNLPLLAKRMQHCAVVSGLTSTQGAHQPGQYLLRTGHKPQSGVQHPSLGAWLIHQQGRLHPDLPPFVVVNGGSRHPGAGALSATCAPMPLGSASKGLPYHNSDDPAEHQRYRQRLELREQLGASFVERLGARADVQAYHNLYHEAVQLLDSADLSAFDIQQESEVVQQRYGDHAFGQGCLLARRLVEHGTRFVEVTLGGWDTHQDNFTAVAEQSAILDQAMSTLLDDLYARGLLSECLVVLGTEFGRSPKITKDLGRNHHPAAFSCVLAGGGVQGGQRYGASDPEGLHVDSGRMTLHDFHASIAYGLGLSLVETLQTTQGRPLSVAGGAEDKPQIHHQLFA